MPYFFRRLAPLSPPTDLGPPSESDFLLLADDRAEDRRTSFGPAAIRSFRVNLCPPSEWTDGAREGGREGGCEGAFSDGAVGRGSARLARDAGVGATDGLLTAGVDDCRAGAVSIIMADEGSAGAALEPGGTILFPDTPADILGALLGLRLGGRVEGGLNPQLPSSESDGDSNVEGVVDPFGVKPDRSRGGVGSCRLCRAARVSPGSFGYASVSAGGIGTETLGGGDVGNSVTLGVCTAGVGG